MAKQLAAHQLDTDIMLIFSRRVLELNNAPKELIAFLRLLLLKSRIFGEHTRVGFGLPDVLFFLLM